MLVFHCSAGCFPLMLEECLQLTAMAMEGHLWSLMMGTSIKAPLVAPSSPHLDCRGSSALAVKVGPSSVEVPSVAHLLYEHCLVWGDFFGSLHWMHLRCIPLQRRLSRGRYARCVSLRIPMVLWLVLCGCSGNPPCNQLL